MVLDLLKPFYYKLEKSVAAKSIPPVHEIDGRWTLASVGDQPGASFDHSLWDKLLQKHVSVGGTVGPITDVHVVDYAGLSVDPDFDKYLSLLEAAQPNTLSPREQLAFWMNAYNAFCIRLIVQHEKDTTNTTPLTSINQLSSSSDGPVWDKIAGTIHAQPISLNHIEHERLRKVWNEPSLHGCIVCASASCPNLRREAFVADRLEGQMKDQMINWMSNPTKGIVVPKQSTWWKGPQILLSRIFLWFADDFGGWKGTQEWLPQYLEGNEAQKLVAHGKVALRFFEYDWTINRKE